MRAWPKRIREVTADGPQLSERKVSGGLCFLYEGHMSSGVIGASEGFQRSLADRAGQTENGL